MPTSHEPPPPPQPSRETPNPAPAELPQSVDFEQLAGGAREVQIIFHGQVYRLRKTRNERLILTK